MFTVKGVEEAIREIWDGLNKILGQVGTIS